VFEAGNAQIKAGVHGQIHHVEHENDGPAEVEHLMYEVEVSLEVGGVDDADDAVGLRHVGATTKEHIAHNGLVGRTRRERISARQIDDGDRAPCCE